MMMMMMMMMLTMLPRKIRMTYLIRSEFWFIRSKSAIGFGKPIPLRGTSYTISLATLRPESGGDSTRAIPLSPRPGQVLTLDADCSNSSPRVAHLHAVGMLRFMSDINQPSLPTPCYSVLVSVSVFMILSTVFHSINSPDNSPFSHFSGLISTLLVLSTVYLFLKVSFSPDIIPSG